MTETVRIPEPVFERVKRESNQKDVPRGVVIRDWMEKADKYDEIETARR